MRILLVTEFFPEGNTHMSGGVESQSYWLSRHMSELGHQVIVVSRKKVWIEASVLSLLSRFWFQMVAVFRGLRIPADVVEGSNYVCYLPAYVIARLKGVRAVARYHDVFGKDWFIYMPLLVATVGYLMEWISWRLNWDKVIAVSKTTKQRLINVGVDEKRISVIYNGVDFDSINAIKVNKFDQPTICVVTRLVSYKRVEFIVRAFQKVLDQVPDLRLLIVGSGPEQPNLKAMVDHLGLVQQVQFVGILDEYDEVIKMIKRSHVTCSATLKEGFGLVTIESMACGVPYVNSDIPATREVTKNGKGGILYPVGDNEGLADGLAKLLRDERFRKKKVSEGKQLVKKYDWDTISKITSNEYKKLM